MALNDAVVLHVPEDAFDTFIKDDPQNAIVIMKTMARNFSMVNMNMNHVFAQHYLALICAQGYTTRRQITAQLWTNLCRLYEDAADKELELLAADRAAQAWMDVDEYCVLTPSQEQRAQLMIAAMLWKIGKGSEAREWAIKSRTNHSGKLYSDIAGQLTDEIRESAEQN